MDVEEQIGFVAALGAVSLLVFAAWIVEVWGGSFATNAVDDIGQLVLGVFATACCFLAAVRSLDSGRQRATWLGLGGGLGAWSVGQSTWCYYELWQRLAQTPFPSPADAAYLAFPVGAAAALILFPGCRSEQSRTRLVLDGIIVTGSLFVVTWMTVLGSVSPPGVSCPGRDMWLGSACC